MYKKITFLFVAILLTLPTTGHATENAGFVDGIWFSKQNTVEGETIGIFVAVQNQAATTADGTVTFFDAGKQVGEVAFSVPPNSIDSVNMQYTLGAGEHPISARITPSEDSQLIYTTLPVRTLFTKAKPRPITPTIIQETTTELLSTLESVASSTAVQTVAGVANTVASSSSILANNIFTKIDPKAKEIAESLREKSAELLNTPISSLTATNTELVQKGPNKIKQLAAVGLSALAFLFQNWFWHLIVLGSLIILRAIYRSRVI